MPEQEPNFSNSLWPNENQERLLHLITVEGEDAFEILRNWLNTNATLDIKNVDLAELMPILYQKIIAHPTLVEEICPTIITQLKLKYIAYKSLAIQQHQHWTPLLVQLNSSKIDSILIKGASLQQDYYGNTGLRSMSDIDILVPTAQRSLAENTITGLGWHEVRKRLDNRDSNLSHALTFSKPTLFGCTVDLHTHVLANCFDTKLDKWFTQNTELAVFGDTRVRRMNPTALLTHTILHGLKVDDSGQTRWILDARVIFATRSADINWESMLGFAERFKLLYRLKLGLEYLQSNKYITLPAQVQSQLAGYKAGWFEKFECNYLFKNRQMEGKKSYLILSQHLVYRAIRLNRPLYFPISLLRVCKHHINGDNWRNVIRRIVFFR